MEGNTVDERDASYRLRLQKRITDRLSRYGVAITLQVHATCSSCGALETVRQKHRLLRSRPSYHCPQCDRRIKKPHLAKGQLNKKGR